MLDQTPQMPRQPGHGALALIRQRDLVCARMELARPDATREQVCAAAQVLRDKGNEQDRARGARIHMGAVS